MPDFSKGSTFNQDANFQGVKFGADAPLLETELNELQDIQTEARAEIIRDTIPSGFVQLGELDFDYMLNNENCVKLKTDSVAYVNGYKIKIPKDTIINIGKAPEKDAREDLLFLEVWKEEVTKDSQLTVTGGEGQASITNDILDPRVGQETSRRVALKWRIRHVPNVDFSVYDNDGFCKLSNTSSYNTSICPQGARTSIPTSTDIISSIPNYTGAFFRSLKYSNIQSVSGKDIDNGLFIVGWNKGSYVNHNNIKSYFNTVDGYVYAIPMFRLYRKPSCGKAIPFEYQKINPKVDYTKFTNLMREEKVERVTSETISGRSLVNYSVYSNLNSNPLIVKASTLKENTDYTAIFNITNNSVSTRRISMELQNKWATFMTPQLVNPGESKKIVVKCVQQTLENLKYNIVWVLKNSSQENQAFTDVSITNCILIEGDWTNKEIPEYFTGLKSLGEDEGNLIEVKTGILNESSYDPSTGNAKLNTVSGTNYISSDNLIMPNIEAQVKRGETKLSDLTSFGKVDSLVGDEKVEFTKIKGRTLQNLHNKTNYIFSYNGVTKDTDFTVTTRDNYIKVERLTSTVPNYTYFNCGVVNKKMLKPSTKYTIVFGKNVNVNRVVLTEGSSTNQISDNANIVNGKALITTASNINIGANQLIYAQLNNYNTNTVFELENIMILEGDYTNTPLDQLPYINEIKSVGENEENKICLCATNKNLIKCPSEFEWDSLKQNLGGDFGVELFKLKLSSNESYNINIAFEKIKGNITDGYGGVYVYVTDEVFSVYPWFASNIFDSRNIRYKKLDGSEVIKKTLNFNFRNNENYKYLIVCIGVSYSKHTTFKINDFVVSKTSDGSDLIKSNTRQQIITLKEPLRSLPNNVNDTIEGNKVIRRVGKVVLSGNESWTDLGGARVNDVTFFAQCSVSPNMKGISNYTIGGYCNTFKFMGATDVYNIDTTVACIGINAQGLVQVRQLKSVLSSSDIQGLKKWLSQNPTTIYYELANPVEELIEPNYDKESIKTYQLDAPLRSLPNGVKDEIVGDKLIRRCGEVILNGTEVWKDLEKNDNFVKMSLGGYPVDMKYGVHGYCDKFNFMSDQSNSTMSREYIGSTSDKYFAILLSVSASRLSSQDTTGFKNWLKANPVKVVYELATPIEIPLKEVHSNTFKNEAPHHEINTYCGSLYVGNGTNDVFVENGLGNDGVVIDTPFRSIENKAVVDDCRYKKNVDGYTTYETVGKGKNLANPVTPYVPPNKGFTVFTNFIRVKKGEKFTVRFKGKVNNTSGECRFFLRNFDYNFNIIDAGYDNHRPTTELTEYMSTTTCSSDGILALVGATSDYSRYTVQDIQIELGETSTSFEKFIPTTRYLENTESNDVDDLRHLTSLVGFNYDQILNESFDSLLRGEL